MQGKQLYERDTAAWAAANAELLRQRRFGELDVPHLIEELEDMGKSERRALESCLSALLMHLLKWMHQPSPRCEATAGTFRFRMPCKALGTRLKTVQV